MAQVKVRLQVVFLFYTKGVRFISVALTWKVWFFFSGLSHDDDDDSFCILQPRIS